MKRTDVHVAPHHWVPAGVLAAAMILLAGCAAMEPKTPEEAVSARAQARWEALLAKDYDTAYTYYSPGYRSAMTLKAFGKKVASQRVRWTEAEFQGVSCRGQVCQAGFEVTYEYRVPVQGVGKVTTQTKVEEDWVLSGGEWFYVPPEAEGLR